LQLRISGSLGKFDFGLNGTSEIYVWLSSVSDVKTRPVYSSVSKCGSTLCTRSSYITAHSWYILLFSDVMAKMAILCWINFCSWWTCYWKKCGCVWRGPFWFWQRRITKSAAKRDPR